MLRSASSIAFFTLLSRIFGLMRDVVLAATLGGGPIADAFMVAFRLPNHFRAVIEEGAFNSAFVPTYSAMVTGEGGEAAAGFRAQILTWVSIANLVLLAIGLGATGWLIMLVAPGFAGDPAQLGLAVERYVASRCRTPAQDRHGLMTWETKTATKAERK